MEDSLIEARSTFTSDGKKLNELLLPEQVFILENKGLNESEICNTLEITTDKLLSIQASDNYINITDSKNDLKKIEIERNKLLLIANSKVFEKLVDYVENHALPALIQDPLGAGGSGVAAASLIKTLLQDITRSADKFQELKINIQNNINMTPQREAEIITSGSEHIDSITNKLGSDGASDFLMEITEVINKYSKKAEMKNVQDAILV